MVDADVVIIEHGVGHLLWRADKAGAVAGRAGERRDTGPEALVLPVGAGSFEEAERARIGRAMAGERQAGGDAIFAHLFLNVGGALPGGFLRVGDDRAKRQGKAGAAAVPRGGLAHRPYRVLHGG